MGRVLDMGFSKFVPWPTAHSNCGTQKDLLKGSSQTGISLEQRRGIEQTKARNEHRDLDHRHHEAPELAVASRTPWS